MRIRPLEIWTPDLYEGEFDLDNVINIGYDKKPIGMLFTRSTAATYEDYEGKIIMVTANEKKPGMSVDGVICNRFERID